ncbi:MAG: hypothetical protein AB7G75_07655 [Candidatus Binatia bacterium]
MKKALVIAACCGTVLVLTYAGAQPGPSRGDPPDPPSSVERPSVAGVPYNQAQTILGRHEQELIYLPGADRVSMDSEGIIVYTSNPTEVPPQIEGLPVRAMPPLGPTPFSSGEEASGPLIPEAHEKMEPLAERQCGTEAYWDAALGQCQRHPQSAVPDPNLLPPPPGVIILWPGGKREQADTCPDGFTETLGLNGWRLCLAPGYSEPIPPLEAPPIAGIAYEEALKILERH